MSANPHANGGAAAARPATARLPRLRRRRAGARRQRAAEATRVLGRRSCATSCARNPTTASGSSGPDETASNRLGARVRGHRPDLGRPSALPATTTSRRDGRVMEILSEHLCQGWLEGYLLTGRHGLFSCYEAFIHIVDSMFNQHAKWLKVTRDIPWRRPIASLNYLLTLARLAPGPQRLLPPGPRLHRPRGEQEGRGHPGLPAAGRQHACCRWPTTACAAGDYVNVIVAGKQPALRVADMDDGGRCTAPAASASGTGPAPTTRRRARRRAGLRRRRARRWRRWPPSTCCASTCPDLRVRVVNVVDLMRLQPDDRAPARPVRRASSTRCSPPTSR